MEPDDTLVITEDLKLSMFTPFSKTLKDDDQLDSTAATITQKTTVFS